MRELNLGKEEQMEQLSMKTVYLNGRSTLIAEQEVVYKDVIRLIHGPVIAEASPVFTVTYCYRGKADGIRGGSMWPGSPSVKVEDNMSFTAVITGAA